MLNQLLLRPHAARSGKVSSAYDAIGMFKFSLKCKTLEEYTGSDRGERGDYVIRGGRLLSVLSRRRDLRKPNSIEVLSAFLGRGADRRWGFGAS